jgi:hypothetical protein
MYIIGIQAIVYIFKKNASAHAAGRVTGLQHAQLRPFIQFVLLDTKKYGVRALRSTGPFSVSNVTHSAVASPASLRGRTQGPSFRPPHGATRCALPFDGHALLKNQFKMYIFKELFYAL